MTIEHKFLVGTSIDYQKALFFDLVKNGEVYMGFSRKEPIWGFSTLVKIDHTRGWPLSVMGQDGDEIAARTDAEPGFLEEEKFYDINSQNDLLPDSIPTNSIAVYIAYVDKNDDAANIANYTFLDSQFLGTLELDYMNEQWVRIRGLNPDFLESTLADFPIETFDYKLFNWNQDILSRTEIQNVDKVALPTTRFPIRLMYSQVTNATVPTSAFGNNIVGNLIRSIDIFGQELISELNTNFVTVGNGYIEDNNLTNAVFFLTNAGGDVIQNEMKYIETVITKEETSIIFSYPIVAEATQNSGRMKITTSINPVKLSIFAERFSDGIDVNDTKPVPLVLNYLKLGMIHSSLLDILGIARILPSEVKFARRIDNQSTEDLLAAVEDIDFNEIQIITIKNNPDTTVKFAITSSIEIAQQFFFDLVQIEKTVPLTGVTSPTEDVYRQLFICYKPKFWDDSDPSKSNHVFAPAVNNIYTESQLRSPTDGVNGQHTFDIGTLLFLVNKEPIFRKHLTVDETFTLLI